MKQAVRGKQFKGIDPFDGTHVELTLMGSIPSKKNTMRRGRHGGMYNAAQKELDGLVLSLMSFKREFTGLPMTRPCRLSLCVWDDDRKDLNNTVTTICDLLEDAGFVKNDRLIKQIEAQKIVDGDNPRVDIELVLF